MPWLKRKHGSSRQVGQPFPVNEDPKVSARRNAIGRGRDVQAKQLSALAAKERGLRPIFEKYAGEDWKAPIDAVVPTRQEASLLAEAIEFFQGSESEISEIDVAVAVSKDALVHVPGKAYRVVSEGYMG
jgi:hypothetical protein